MNYQIHYTNQVKEDLKRALGYIKFTLKNPQAAQALLDEANQLIASLSQLPGSLTVPPAKNPLVGPDF